MDRRKQRRHHVVHPLSLAVLTLLAATLWPARARPEAEHLVLAPTSFSERDTEAALPREGRRDVPGVLAGGFCRQAFRPAWTLSSFKCFSFKTFRAGRRRRSEAPMRQSAPY
jgi:hypothetical protein